MNHREATEAYLNSDEGKRSLDGSTIGVSAHNEQYLRNRILLAFAAGLSAGKAIAAEEARENQVVKEFIRKESHHARH